MKLPTIAANAMKPDIGADGTSFTSPSSGKGICANKWLGHKQSTIIAIRTITFKFL